MTQPTVPDTPSTVYTVWSPSKDPGPGAGAVFGWIALVGGVAWMVMAMRMSTTGSVVDALTSGRPVGVHNLGLLNRQLVHTIAAATTVLGGLVLIIADGIYRLLGVLGRPT